MIDSLTSVENDNRRGSPDKQTLLGFRGMADGYFCVRSNAQRLESYPLREVYNKACYRHVRAISFMTLFRSTAPRPKHAVPAAVLGGSGSGQDGHGFITVADG
jgi:hypothetical protein